MRHASADTTARYINYSQQVRPTVQAPHVPNALRLPAPKQPAKAE